MLGEQILDLAHAGARAPGDTHHPAGLADEEAAVALELGGGHAVADADHAAQLRAALGVVEPAGHGAEAGDHAGHLRERAHLHDVRQLVPQVPHREHALGQVLDRVLLVELQRLHVLEQAGHVAHAEQLGDEGLWREPLEIEHVLARADEHDGRVGGGDGGDGAAARGRAVRLRDDDGTKVGCVFECPALRFGLLADAGVEHHDGLVRLYGVLDLHHLFEQVFFLSVSAARVDNDDLEAFLLEALDAFPRHDRRVCLRERAVVGDLGFCRVLLELVKGSRPEGVGADHARLEAADLVPSGELRAGCCLAGALQADEHYDVCLALFRSVGVGMWIDELNEFVENGLFVVEKGKKRKISRPTCL